jgi:hypothetical protein
VSVATVIQSILFRFKYKYTETINAALSKHYQ